VLNVLDSKPKVEIVFHGLNPDDPDAKIRAFQEIIGGSMTHPELRCDVGQGGHVAGSSSYFRWVTLSRE